MLISDAIQALNPYPVPYLAIQKMCIDRALDAGSMYTLEIGASVAFELLSADYYVYIANAPNLQEMNVSITSNIGTREDLIDKANKIYSKHGDAKYDGRIYGFKGEAY